MEIPPRHQERILIQTGRGQGWVDAGMEPRLDWVDNWLPHAGQAVAVR